jgi:hypothetical protein
MDLFFAEAIIFGLDYIFSHFFSVFFENDDNTIFCLSLGTDDPTAADGNILIHERHYCSSGRTPQARV